MKKYIVYLLISLIIIIPIKTNAVNETWTQVVAKEEASTGETVDVDFSINFEDVANSNVGYGIYVVAFEIDFDDTVLDIVGIEDNKAWNTNVYQDSETKKYMVVSEHKDLGAGGCGNGTLHCNKYTMKVSFFVKDTDKTSTNIKIGEFAGITVKNSIKSLAEIQESDVKTITGVGNMTHTYKITKTEKEIVQPKTSIVEEKKVDITNEIKKEVPTTNNNNGGNTTTTGEDNSNKAYDNYLKTLEIEGYKLDFNKHISIYSLSIPQNINELKVTAVPESNKSTVKVIGADNLEENNNKIIIEVTSGNNEVKKYVINIDKIEEETNKKSTSFEITEEQKKIAIIFASVVLGIGLIIYIIIRIRDRKIEKGLNKW